MGADANRSLAAHLEPLLAEACEGRLGPITWFKADWQRGGAATGKSTYRTDDGEEAPVVIKMPVVQREYTWTLRLQDQAERSPVVPRLYASGSGLGDYDLAWLVIEHFPHGPLGLQWGEQHVPRIAEAIARFHQAASAYPVDQQPRTENWADLIEQSHESVRRNGVADGKRWTAALKSLNGRLDGLVEEWNGRSADQWLHGDAHLANAMSREAMDHGTVSLIDLAEVHAGHWIEDAVYLERQLWARPERLKPHKPVKAVAAARKQLGLPVERDYPRLAMIRRALLAATAPRYIRSEGSPAHLAACLGWLETALREVKDR